MHALMYLLVGPSSSTSYDYDYGVSRHFQQYFSYIVAVSFIGGGNRSPPRKPLACRKSLTNNIT